MATDDGRVDGYASSSDHAKGPAQISLCKVLNVNVQEWTCDLEGVYTMQPHYDVPFATPYCHRDHAGGVNFVPEVDAQCYVCVCGDGTKFILGFILGAVTQAPTHFDEEEETIDEANADIKPSYRGFRDPLEAGDIMLGTVDENQIVVRRGGMIQIGATGLAQRVYLPVENIIRDYFQQYQAHSPIGEIEWGHAVLAAGEEPAKGTGSQPASNYFLDEGQKNALKTAEETPVLVRYSLKD